MDAPILLAVPNVSEGRRQQVIAAVGQAFAGGAEGIRAAAPGTAPPPAPAPAQGGVRLLDVHADPHHHRSVFTLAGAQGRLAGALLEGAREAVAQIDVMARAAGGPVHAGQHPHVGAVDVVPIVYLRERDRGAACAEALVVADMIGSQLEVPVFLYGELTAADASPARTRAALRRGGVAALAARMSAALAFAASTAPRTGSAPASGAPPNAIEGLPPDLGTPGDAPSAGSPGSLDEPRGEPLAPDFGPPHMHPTAGATLVAARPPLVAFNLQLAPGATLADARGIAAAIREGGAEGLPGLRAIGVQLGADVAQVSMNVERPFELSLAAVAAAVARHAPIASAELVGLAPRAALEGFPPEIPMPGFDPERHVIENALDD